MRCQGCLCLSLLGGSCCSEDNSGQGSEKSRTSKAEIEGSKTDLQGISHSLDDEKQQEEGPFASPRNISDFFCNLRQCGMFAKWAKFAGKENVTVVGPTSESYFSLVFQRTKKVKEDLPEHEECVHTTGTNCQHQAYSKKQSVTVTLHGAKNLPSTRGHVPSSYVIVKTISINRTRGDSCSHTPKSCHELRGGGDSGN